MSSHTGNKSIFDTASPRSKAPGLIHHRQPNLLFIHTDEQHFQAMSAFGNPHVDTPNMDRLAKRGVAFNQSYSANPVCAPARSCWYTGRTSSETGCVTNLYSLIVADMPDMGQWFSSRGYEAVYSGKWHIPGREAHKSFNALIVDPVGIGEYCDTNISESAQAFFHNYRGDKPFFLSLGFTQPHDIILWVIANERDIGHLPYPSIADELPPLPDNFSADPRQCETFLRYDTRIRKGIWSELTWRYYLWSYYRMVEMADAQIGRVLDALESSRFADNTLILFTSDHGEGLSRHLTVGKDSLYDEAARVHLIASWPGHIPEGIVDDVHLVSGLDIAPTLCDYAGIELMPKARGRSLKSLMVGNVLEWREFIVSEVQVNGHMIRTPEYKFITYEGDSTSQLFDMRSDPGETTNLAIDSKYANTVSDLRRTMYRWERQLEKAPLVTKMKL